MPAVLYMAAIWVASSMPVPDVAIDRVPFQDKGVHFIEYFGLAACVAHAMLRSFPGRGHLRVLAASLLVALGWGVLDELHQAFVPGRSSDVLDLVADALGATLGTAVRYAARSLRRSRETP